MILHGLHMIIRGPNMIVYGPYVIVLGPYTIMYIYIYVYICRFIYKFMCIYIQIPVYTYITHMITYVTVPMPPAGSCQAVVNLTLTAKTLKAIPENHTWDDRINIEQNHKKSGRLGEVVVTLKSFRRNSEGLSKNMQRTCQ